MAPDDYLARVVAEPSGGWLVAVLPRAQRSLRWLRVTPDGVATELWTEASEPWFNLDDHTRVLSDGCILRTHRAHGLPAPRAAEPTAPSAAAHRGRVDRDRCRPRRRGSAGRCCSWGPPTGATERHLYAVPLDAEEPAPSPQRLTDRGGLARRGRERRRQPLDRHLVERSSTRQPSASGTAMGEARSWSTPPRAAPHRWVVGRRSSSRLLAADGSTPLDAALYRPAAPSRLAPALRGMGLRRTTRRST